MTRDELIQLSRRVRRRGKALALKLRQPRRTDRPPTGAKKFAEAVHVGIPDGETLWLAVHGGATDTLALRDVATGLLADLPTETDAGDETLRTTRFVLVSGGKPAVANDVAVVVRDSARNEIHPVIYQGDSGTIEQIPRIRSGTHRFAIGTDDGTLHVHHRTEPPFAKVIGMDVTTVLEVRFTAPEGLRPVVVGLSDDGEELGRIPCEVMDDHLRLRIAHDSMSVSPGGRIDLVVDPARRVPLKRGFDDLSRPNAAVVLPALPAQDPESDPPQLRYRRDGRLTLTCSPIEAKGKP